MSDVISDNIEIYKGLQKTFQRMRWASQNAHKKILFAKEHYFTAKY